MMGAQTESRESECPCGYDQPLGICELCCEVLLSPFLLKPSQKAR
jgi:hypothetical protein